MSERLTLSCDGKCDKCKIPDIECSQCGRLMCPSEVRFSETDTIHEFPICESCDKENEPLEECMEIDMEESDLP